MMTLNPWSTFTSAKLSVPGDKSMTHRGILMSVLADGEMVLDDWLDSQDTRASLALALAFGALVVEDSPKRLVLRSPGTLKVPGHVVDCANSGTTMRLALGIAAACPGLTVLSGDASLSRRPMARVIEPLSRLGISIRSRAGGFAPLAIQGGSHQGGSCRMTVASAQVKSALLLAGLTAEGPLTVEEPIPTRDHTERLIEAMGGSLQREGSRITVTPGSLNAISFRVPGDPSSAAFWAALAVLWPASEVEMTGIMFNPGRTAFFHALTAMGAQVRCDRQGSLPEPWGSISVTRESLRAITIGADTIPAMIDEVSLLALIATQSRGVTVVRGAGELRVKESDRIRTTHDILRAMGGRIEELEDGWRIEGPTPLHGASVDARGDHRMAMMAAIAATIAEGPTYLTGEESVAISYPQFFQQYHQLAGSHA